jgi:hypothetical protein
VRQDSRLAGYKDVNGVERLSQDPTFRLGNPEKIWEPSAALSVPMGLPKIGQQRNRS